ncbi:4'-phosphopantetheinyl transferase superfamily protein [Adlercreutzia sp. ZJ473]|uniref:4'-phosphopantetheinyl transferase superfamily protein n=1 Tax=Adlercreutzia sp. ZJ473 TaxID=2722822 RepID=UPI00155341A6
MIRGIGIDAVTISEFERLLEGPDNFAGYTFTERELSQSEGGQRSQKLAGCFAAKEAAFKAIAPLLPERTFDFRLIELLRNEDGSPTIARNDKTLALLEDAAITNLHVSLTNEGDLAMAFVIAEAVGAEE